MPASDRLQPLPYHVRLLEHLKSHEGDLWSWFASTSARTEHFDAVKLKLLRSTYCIDRETQPALYTLAKTAAGRLGIDLPITLYQAQQSGEGLNASLVWMPGEAHIVLQGPVGERLTEPEMTAVFGHELAHAALWSFEDGAYHIAENILDAMHDDRGAAAHERSHRLFRLYTEAFCDRGALIAADDLETAVSALVKIETGVTDVNAQSFLQQADEVLTADNSASDGQTHPETVIRARCLRLWSEQADDADEQICAMIEGPLALTRLDLLQQVRLTQLTRDLVAHLLEPKWMCSELIVAHARLFFDDGHLPDGVSNGLPPEFDFKHSDDDLVDYVCYLLLDFGTCDAELQDQALARVLLLSRRFEIEEAFVKLATDALKLRKRQIETWKEQAEQIVAAAAGAGGDA